MELFDAGFLADPYPVYRRLRETTPVFPFQPGRWLICRHDDAVRLLTDPRCDHWGQNGGRDANGSPVETALAQSLQALSPEPPALLRGMMGRLLSDDLLNRLGEEMDRGATTVLERIKGRERIEFISDYAHPLTFSAICRIMGVPTADVPELMRLVGRMEGSYLGCVALSTTPDPLQEEALRFVAYLRDLVRTSNRSPDSSLIGQLQAHARQVEEAQFGEEAILNLMLVLFYAGHQNMMYFLANALLALCQHPESCAALRRQPQRLPTAVMELLRYDSPLQFILLTSGEALMLRGQRVAAGDQVFIGVGAANRDPEAFSDPDCLDWERDARGHLAFGWGPYRCIGARLALRQGTTALGRFLTSIPSFHLTDAPLQWRAVPMVQRGLQTLPLQDLSYA